MHAPSLLDVMLCYVMLSICEKKTNPKTIIKTCLHLCYECREDAVHVLGFEVSEEELKDGLKGSPIQR